MIGPTGRALAVVAKGRCFTIFFGKSNFKSMAERTIIHIDMDAFYASVEVRDRPELAGRPVIVGGTPESRGVVAAASYEARRYGIHSAMPAGMAKRLCPDAVFLPPRHDYYAEISEQLHNILQRYTPVIERLALDEAFLDVTGSEKLLGSGVRIGGAIKEAVREELGLVASVGVAPNKFLAKLASDDDKPDGFVVIRPEDVQRFLAPLPIRRLWGVGKVTGQVFERLGIRTVGQLRHYSRQLLQQHLGGAAEQLWALAHGQDQRPVVPDQEAKSVSHETTFASDVHDGTALRAWLKELSEQVARRLRRQGLRGRTVSIKIRYADFTTVTRSQSLPVATDVTADIWRVAQEMFTARLPRQQHPVRLIGVGVSGFSTIGEPCQESLFADSERERQSRLDEVVDAIKDRFGKEAVRRGLDPDLF